MADLNFWGGEIWMGGGLTWTYIFHGIDARYNDIWVSPAVGTGPGPSNLPGNVEIVRKWCVSTGQEIQLWFTVRNNSPAPVYFAYNIINVTP
jgi:hypothetical protein